MDSELQVQVCHFVTWLRFVKTKPNWVRLGVWRCFTCDGSMKTCIAGLDRMSRAGCRELLQGCDVAIIRIRVREKGS